MVNPQQSFPGGVRLGDTETIYHSSNPGGVAHFLTIFTSDNHIKLFKGFGENSG